MCSIDGCTKRATHHASGEFCQEHGGQRRYKQDGCNNLAQQRGVCKRHGALNYKKKHAPPKVARSNPCEMACARGMATLITQYCAQKKVAVTKSIHEKCVSTTPGKKPVTRKLVPTSYAPLSSQTIGTPMAVLYQEPS